MTVDPQLQARLDVQGICLACTIACIDSIKANSIHLMQPLTDEQYAEIEKLYDHAYKIQEWIVHNKPLE